MPQYQYRAIDKHSHVSSGVLVAESETVLEHRIAELGLWLIEARIASGRERSAARIRVPRRALIDFFNGLASLVDAGIDVAESLKVLVSECEHEGLRHVLHDLELNIQSGASFYEAMSAHPEVFTAEISNLVRAGEHSGQLVEACADVSEHLDWVDRLMADVKQATLYPAMISVAVLGLVFLMFSFVVPRFALIFDSLEVELPGITKVVVAVGAFCNTYWSLLLVAAVGLVLLFRFGPERIPGMRLSIDRMKLDLPAFGPIYRLLALSRFTHNMALMLKAGVPIVESLALVAGSVGNRVMEAALVQAQLAVTEGRRMSEALSEHQIVSPLVMRMIVVGEETGRLDGCLQKAAERMDAEVPRRIKQLFGVLEPLIIMLLLGVVGLVAASIFLPLFSLMSGIRG